MKKEKASNKALKHIVCCIILIIVFVITITRVQAQNEINVSKEEQESIVPLRLQSNKSLFELVTSAKNEIDNKNNENNINHYIDKYNDTLIFFSNIFGYDIEIIKEDLINRNNDNIIINNNIGIIRDKDNNIIEYPNVEYGIVEYFFDLLNTNRIERKKRLVPYEGNSEYIEKLITFYTSIYTNVDASTALSIGAAESGYYKVKYMLRMNNIYGGMGYNGLIRHENIELGVLHYIRMLSINYYGKGLNTIYDIGYVYCPTVNDYGQKITSPHWIKLVTIAKEKYDNYSKDVTLNDLMNY